MTKYLLNHPPLTLPGYMVEVLTEELLGRILMVYFIVLLNVIRYFLSLLFIAVINYNYYYTNYAFAGIRRPLNI